MLARPSPQLYFQLPPIARRLPSLITCALAALVVSSTFLPGAFATIGSTPLHTLGFTISDDQNNIIEEQKLGNLLSVYDEASGTLSTIPYGTNPATKGVAGWSWSSVDVTSGDTLPQSMLTWASGNASVQLMAAGDVDPTMTYSFSAKNNSLTNQTYAFSYGEAIDPTISGNYFVNADIAGSVTRGNLTQNAQLSPTFSKIQTLRFSTDGGATFLNAGVDVGTTYTSSLKTNPFGRDYAEAYGDLSGINYWQFDVSFTLTPNKDAAALSGSAELIAIPEPSFYAGLMGAVTLMGAAYRRRRSIAL